MISARTSCSPGAIWHELLKSSSTDGVGTPAVGKGGESHSMQLCSRALLLLSLLWQNSLDDRRPPLAPPQAHAALTGSGRLPGRRHEEAVLVARAACSWCRRLLLLLLLLLCGSRARLALRLLLLLQLLLVVGVARPALLQDLLGRQLLGRLGLLREYVRDDRRRLTPAGRRPHQTCTGKPCTRLAPPPPRCARHTLPLACGCASAVPAAAAAAAAAISSSTGPALASAWA